MVGNAELWACLVPPQVRQLGIRIGSIEVMIQLGHVGLIWSGAVLVDLQIDGDVGKGKEPRVCSGKWSPESWMRSSILTGKMRVAAFQSLFFYKQNQILLRKRDLLFTLMTAFVLIQARLSASRPILGQMQRYEPAVNFTPTD